MEPSPLVARLMALGRSARLAAEDDRGRRSFEELLERALGAAAVLRAGAPSLDGRRVLLLVSPGTAWLESFFGIVLSGGVAVPLSPLYPAAELSWFATDSGAETLIVSSDLLERASFAAGLPGLRVLEVEALSARAGSAPALGASDTALLLYTSGTTGKPKGAMITHGNLAVQAELVGAAWGWTDGDRLLHALPLHHLHGLGISLLTSLLAGGATRFLPRFEAARVWEEMAAGRASAWMAVPTMYQKLLVAFDAADRATRERWEGGAAALRLSTSGSAALPVTLAARWRELSGAIPLERFGMTEIGVGMTNPLDPARRRPGSVGMPLPTVGARIVDESGREADSGELWIRGPSVFAGYWGRADATAGAFADGWFRTGDVAERSADGFYRLLGRTSVDILKSGGYKLSALEIEEALREHAAIAEVAVVGIPDATWGERVVAVVVAAPGRAAECASEPLRAWAKERLAAYKVPREVIVVDALPRNAVGKVVKPDLVRALVTPSR